MNAEILCRMTQNRDRDRRVASFDQEAFEPMDYYDPFLHTSMTSEQRRDRAERLIAASKRREEEK